MTIPLYFLKTLSGLRPATPQTEDALAKIKLGATVRADIRQQRSGKQNALYWSILGLVADNMDGAVTSENLHVALKVKLGYVDTVRMRSGIITVPQSTDFGSMAQPDFALYFDKAMNLLVTEAIPGMDKDELLAEVNARLEPRI